MQPEEIQYYERAYCATLANAAKTNESTAATRLQEGTTIGPRTSCNNEGFERIYGDIFAEADVSQHCKRHIVDTGASRLMQVDCDSLHADYTRSDAEHLTGTRRLGTGARPGTEMTVTSRTDTFTAKWISEASAHPPSTPRPTDLNGRQAKGRKAVTRLDPFRVVATMDGLQIIALRADEVVDSGGHDYEERFPTTRENLQERLLHFMVAVEARREHLDLMPPWKDEMDSTQASRIRFEIPDPVDFPRLFVRALDTDENDWFVTDASRFHETDENLLWKAYFAQFATPAAQQSRVQELRRKYALTIIDPDFFAPP
jgi:hypothetical protein